MMIISKLKLQSKLLKIYIGNKSTENKPSTKVITFNCLKIIHPKINKNNNPKHFVIFQSMIKKLQSTIK